MNGEEQEGAAHGKGVEAMVSASPRESWLAVLE